MPKTTKPLSLSDIGERTLIEKIKGWCSKGSSGTHSSKNYTPLVGIGDDAFVAKMSSNSKLVFSTDTLMEGTHFNQNWSNRLITRSTLWKSLGFKAMTANLSDLAAMGDVDPLFSLVTLGGGGDISVDTVDNLYRGMLKSANKYRFNIVGGDIIRSEKSILSITIVGKLNSVLPIRRSGSKIGDVLMVTGHLGLSYLGLKILKNKIKSDTSYTKSLILNHLLPTPKIDEGKVLSHNDSLATSMIDTSDDLISSLEILSRASGVGFRIHLESVPIPRPLQSLPKGWDPYSFLLYGGEDYQLLFTVSPSHVDRVKKRIPGAIVLGEVTGHKGEIEIYLNRKPYHAKDLRFKHF